MDYESMSDFEINKAVAEIIHSKARIDTYYHEDTKRDQVRIEWPMGSFTSDFDPCNNPSDAWPIIVDNKITTDHNPFHDDVKTAYIRKSHNPKLHYTIHTNPLRAAMIVFLMMQEKPNA